MFEALAGLQSDPSMHPAHIAELLEPFLESTHPPEPKTQSLLPIISTYIDILLRWNARINLTAVRDPEEIVTRHFGESLFAARYLFPATTSVGTAALGCAPERSSAVRVADLGSGAGFPGIPIKLWAPQVALTLIESNQKKVAFLREVARAMETGDRRDVPHFSPLGRKHEAILPGIGGELLRPSRLPGNKRPQGGMLQSRDEFSGPQRPSRVRVLA